jgi:hypothetical protein
MKRWIGLSAPLLAAFLACSPYPLSCQESPAGAKEATSANVVSKPTRKPDQVTTTDPIALLAIRSNSATPTSGASNDAGNSQTSETARKAAQIASVEQQIKDKQKRIVLLLRLFVEDERAFVIDPANVNVDPAVAERRRYEQDELHWETAELARLKALRTKLTASP